MFSLIYAERFYAEPHKYALKLQLWILNQRYLTYVSAVKHVLETGVYVGVKYSRSIIINIKNIMLATGSQVKEQCWIGPSSVTMCLPVSVPRKASSLVKVAQFIIFRCFLFYNV